MRRHRNTYQQLRACKRLALSGVLNYTWFKRFMLKQTRTKSVNEQSSRPHPTQTLYCPFTSTYVEIDHLIAHLVQSLWNLGIRTIMSCQNNRAILQKATNPLHGYVWIRFTAWSDFLAFRYFTLRARLSGRCLWDCRPTDEVYAVRFPQSLIPSFELLLL